MRLSDRAHAIDRLCDKLKRSTDERVFIVINGYQYNLELSSVPAQAEIDDIGARIRQFHLDRGCCDGADVAHCPRLLEPPEPPKAKREKPTDEFEGTD
jgi:hypothetical protein